MEETTGTTSFSRSQPIFQLAAQAILTLAVILRQPLLLLKPRFWAEEGQIFFVHAFYYVHSATHSWYDQLAFVPASIGYYSLFPNVATLIAATAVPLAQAPLVTTLLALLVQAIPFTVVLWGNAPLWDSRTKKLIVCTIILLTAPSEEIWLTTTNSQTYFCLITFLLLLEKLELIQSQIKLGWYRILLVVAGMTGVVSCFFTPLFFLKFLRQKQREVAIQTGILLTCSLLHFWFIIHQADKATVISSRLIGFDLSTLLALVWTRTIVSVLAGKKFGKLFAEFVGDPTKIGFAIALVALVFTIAFVSYLFRIRDSDFTKVFLLLGFLFLLLPSVTFSLGNKHIFLDLDAGGRYFFVPNVIFLLSVFYQSKFNTQKRNLSSIVCTFLVPISLLFNLFAYKPEVSLTGNWSSWQQEVSKWQADPAYPLQIWPPGWTVQLPPPSSLKKN